MKRILHCLLLIGVIGLIFSCSKKEKVEQPEAILDQGNVNAEKTIDFEAMKKLAYNSDKLTPEVFFAITILHRQYIETLEAETVTTPDPAQAALFEEKKNEFFKRLKISHEEYMGYYEKNDVAMNRYIQEHPEIMEYLTIDK